MFFGVFVLCQECCQSAHAPPGAVPVVGGGGGACTPRHTVPWGASPREQGGPWAPPLCGEKCPETLLGLCAGSLLGLLGFTIGLSRCGFFVSGIGCDVWFGALQDPTPCLYCCSCPSCSLCVWYVCRRVFYLCLSLSQVLGEIQTLLGSVFSASFSASRPRPTSSTRTPCSSPTPRSRLALVFCFVCSPFAWVGVCFSCSLVLLGCFVV